jgi:hypothetical protein
MVRRLLVLALGVMLVAAAPAEAAKHKPKKKKPAPSLKSIWGPVTMPDGSSAFDVYKRLGVKVFQVQLNWRATASARPASPKNPNDPAYAWPAALDQAVVAARARGIKVAIMVKDTPAWANGGKLYNVAPDRPRDYTNFLVAAAKRYPAVHHWMIWGEPSRSFNWSPLPAHSPVGPRLYAKLLDASYGVLKKRSRRNVVIGGMTFTTGEVTAPEWLRWMRLPNGKPPRLDWYGHNPFAVRKPNLGQKVYYPGVRDFSDLDTLHRELKKAYRKRHMTPRIWVSEYAVSSDHGNRAFGFSVSRAAQAQWLTAAYRIAHRTPWIAGLGWWTLLDEQSSAPDAITTGLLDRTGAPKPAYWAYRRAR